MPMSQVDIVNLALSHICEKTIVTMAEKSVEAQTANQFYNTALYETLRDFSWPFATKYDNLALIPMNPASTSIQVTQANQNWAFAYQYPSDCLYFRRVLSGFYQDTRQSRVPYMIAKTDFINPQPPVIGTPTPPEYTFTPTVDSGMYVFTNQQFAQAEYTYLVTDTSTFPPDFIMAFSYRLAGYMVTRLTGGDPFHLKTEVMALYDAEITKAKASSFNEEQMPQEVPSEFQRVRNGLFYENGTRPPWSPTPSGFSID